MSYVAIALPRAMPGNARGRSVRGLETPGESFLVEVLVRSQPFRGMQKPVVLGLPDRDGVVCRVMNLAVDDLQLLIHFAGYPDFLHSRSERRYHASVS